MSSEPLAVSSQTQWLPSVTLLWEACMRSPACLFQMISFCCFWLLPHRFTFLSPLSPCSSSEKSLPWRTPGMSTQSHTRLYFSPPPLNLNCSRMDWGLYADSVENIAKTVVPPKFVLSWIQDWKLSAYVGTTSLTVMDNLRLWICTSFLPICTLWETDLLKKPPPITDNEMKTLMCFMAY